MGKSSTTALWKPVALGSQLFHDPFLVLVTMYSFFRGCLHKYEIQTTRKECSKQLYSDQKYILKSFILFQSLSFPGLLPVTIRAAHTFLLENFFPLRVTEPWPRLPRGAGESPSLEIFKPHLDKVLCSLLWVTLLGQGVGLGDPQRSLPTPNIL